MWELIQIISATLLGTTVMTAFSYLVSAEFRKTFKEPVLLEYVMKLSHVELGANAKKIAAWLIHYAIGLLFVIAYHILWTCCVEFSWVSGLIFGAISGIIGILGWVVIFSLPSKKPKVDFKSYYIQLFFAHVFFGLGAVAAYKILAVI